ncbi:MAG TPA: AI-2E family transporter, partial [Pyrinomonadaceae bacterium]|nr:AI-2E family transporter [Pyrinomonadaceae bacterium]
SWPQTRAILRVIFIVLAVAGLLWILYRLEGVILLIVLAIFFAYLIAPLVEFVHRPFKVRGREHVTPRALAIGIVYLIIFGSVSIIIYLILPLLSDQIAEFGRQAPTYLTSARARADKLNEIYRDYKLPQGVREAINNAVQSGIETAGAYTSSGLSSVVAWLAYLPWFILIPILAFFLLKDADSFRRSALQVLPRGRWRWRGDEFFQDVNSTLAAYIRAQLTACLLIGAICTLGFALIGMPYWLALGVVAGLLEFIPLAGPLTVALLAALVASFYSFSKVVAVLLFLGVLRIIHDYFIYPRIIGQGIHLHPLAVVLAILCGEELAGLAGIFLAIPVIAVISVSYRHWLEHRGSAGLVADLLKPAEQIVTAPASSDNEAPALSLTDSEPPAHQPEHPHADTTPEQMARARPDLTTGELRLKRTD